MKECRIEDRLASPLQSLSTTRIFRNVGNHAAIENGFAVGSAIVDPIQADDRLVQVKSDLLGKADNLRQCCLQQRRLILIARS